MVVKLLFFGWLYGMFVLDGVGMEFVLECIFVFLKRRCYVLFRIISFCFIFVVVGCSVDVVGDIGNCVIGCRDYFF